LLLFAGLSCVHNYDEEEIQMSMLIQTRGFTLTDALKNAVRTSIDPLVAGHQKTEFIEVRLEDINGNRHGGKDKRCRVVFPLPGAPSMVVSSTSEDMYKAIRHCAARLKHALNKARQRKSGRHHGAARSKATLQQALVEAEGPL
jgi:ribosomal subunit interface protein